MPTAIGHDRGVHGPAGDEDLTMRHGTIPGAIEFQLGPVIRRRI
jgi:hypothetical protein